MKLSLDKYVINEAKFLFVEELQQVNEEMIKLGYQVINIL